MNNSYRYERKLYFPKCNKQNLESIIKTSAIGFKETYYERRINSIYYDTEHMDSYWDNENGQPNRTKLRVRWYGSSKIPTEDAMVELKIKQGLSGFKIKESFFKIKDERIKEMFKKTTPVVLVSYMRKYFMSYDSRFRITVDSEITYKGLLPGTEQKILYEEPGCVVEFKYDNQYDTQASEILARFDTRITKFSKYARGIRACYVY